MSLLPRGYQRILVPVDLSPPSAHALAYALALGDAFASTVDALHVWRTNTETPVSVARERARDELKTFVAGVAVRGDTKLRRRTDYGDPYLTIVRIAQLSSYDLLVVVAPRGADRSEHLALELLFGSRLPVLLVPSSWVEGRKEPDLRRHVRRILLPAAFAGRAVVGAQRAFELAATFDATVEVLFVRDAAVENEQTRFRLALEQNAAFQGRVEQHELDGPFESALTARAEEGGYDLIVLVGQRGSVDQSAADPLVGRLLSLQRCPALYERFD